MENKNSVKQTSKNRGKKFFKFLLFGTACLIVIVVLAQVIWINSGSSKWELGIDKDGIKVYSLKSPGSFLKKFKGTVRVKNVSMNHVAASMIDDNNLENCKAWLPSCIDFKAIESFSPKTLTDANLWTFELFPPFSPREILLKGHLRQDKQTKEIFIDYIAAPNAAPLNDGRVRVTHFHNSWQYIPQPNGDVEIVHVQDFDMGGLFPAFC